MTTDATGHFGLTFTCPSAGALMYVSASGGHIGAAAANSAIQLTSALGACGSLPASIVVNELTTAAAAYALSGFAVPTGGTPSVKFQGKSPGLNQAFSTLSNLTVTSTGAFETTGPETNKTQVQQTLDTLANAMAACDVSTPAGAACSELFTCARIGATYASHAAPCTGGTSPQPADTLSATLAVTLNPGTVGLQGIFDVGTTTGNLFSSAVLAATPNDWTLMLVYPVTNWGPLAIDAAGHLWILGPDPNPGVGNSNPNMAVLEFDANFNQLSPSAHGWTGGGVTSFDRSDVTNLAIDAAGHVWISGTGPVVAELNSQGAAVSPAGGWSTGSVGPDGTAGIAIDALGNAWIASGDTASTVFELSSTGTPLSPTSTGYTASNCPCNGIAADSSGGIWTLGGGSTSAGLAGINSVGVQGSILYPPGYNNNTYFNSIAADASGNLWIADKHNHGIWEYSVSGATWAGASGGGPFPNIAALNNPSTPGRIAIDAAGHKWVANQSTLNTSPPASSLTEFSADGSTNLSPIDGFGSGSINGAYTVAVDGSGNVWVTAGGTSIVEFVGAAAPTRNPIVSAVMSGFAP